MLQQHLTDFGTALALPTQALLVYVAVWIICMLRNFRYRMLGNRVHRAALAQPIPKEIPVSVVLVFQGDEAHLRSRLSLFLGQHYSPFEVIVVCEQQPTDSVKQYFTDMQHAYPYLSTCVVPSKGLDISVHNLAITLGVRAAQYDWVLFSNLDCAPQSSLWLACMASRIAEGKHIIAGITNYAASRGPLLLQHRFLYFWRQMLLLTWAYKHKLIEADVTNLLYYKPFFMQHSGLVDGAKLRDGAVQLAVNRHACRHDTAVCLHPDAIIWQDVPHSAQAAQWQCVAHHYVWRRLRWAWWLDMCSNAHALLTWLHTLTFAFVLLLMLCQPNIMPVHLAVLLVLWLLQAVWRNVCFNHSVRALHLSPLHALLPLALHLQPWWALATRFRCLMTDKKQFRKRFV